MIVKEQSSPEDNLCRINLTVGNVLNYRQGMMLRDDDEEELESENDGAVELSEIDVEMGAKSKGRR